MSDRDWTYVYTYGSNLVIHAVEVKSQTDVKLPYPAHYQDMSALS